MSYTQLGYPSAFASEGNPLAGGGFPGDFDPYVHTARDTMDVDDETGEFSLDVSASKNVECALLMLIAHGPVHRARNRICGGAGRLG